MNNKNGFLEKTVKVEGIAIAIVSFVVGLAMMSGDSTLASPGVGRLLSIPNYLSFLCIIICFAISPKTFKPVPSLICLVVIYWGLQTFHTYSSYSQSLIKFSTILMLVFCCLCDKSLLYGFKTYKVLLVIMALLGIIAYVSYLFSLGLPYSIEPYYSRDGTTGWTYVNYRWAYIVQDFSGLRLCGLFNEPGLFGTIIALVLIADNINLKKIENIILLISGFLSFSLAFVILLVIALLIMILHDFKNIKYLIIVSLSLFIIVPVLMEKFEIVAHLLERIRFENGSLTGDNRTNDYFDFLYQQMFSDGKALFGYGHGFNEIKQSGGLSYKKVVIEYGFLGVAVMWGLLLKEAVKKSVNNNRRCWMFIVCFFASIYQRPSVLSLNYFLILFGGLAYIMWTIENDNDQISFGNKNTYKSAEKLPSNNN